MTENEKLFNELKKLSKRANQRIVRLERLTGIKEGFATKQLADYLSSEQVQGWTKKGRVRVSKSMTDTQMIAAIKATKNFLEDVSNSTQKGLKKQKKEIEGSIGKPVSYSQMNTLYTASQLYKWANDEFGSRFWQDFAPLVFSQTKNEWVEYCATYIDKINDTIVLNKLKVLYDYLKKE